MKILVLGSGLMGPAAAFNAMGDPDVTQVTLCDLDALQLEAAKRKLSKLGGGDKVDTVQLDLSDEQAAIDLMRNYDAIVAALPNTVIPLGLRAGHRRGHAVGRSKLADRRSTGRLETSSRRCRRPGHSRLRC